MIADRRQLLAGAAAAALLPLAGRANAASLRRIGLQLYTVRELFKADPVATLRQVARIGYREVEFGGGDYEKMDHALLRRTMDRLGLRAPSLHIGYDMLRDRFDASVAMAKTLGADTVVLPFMMPDQRNAAAWTTAVADFNRIAERLRGAGLGFAYHNHDFEFALKPDGVSLYDRLLRDTDPALVNWFSGPVLHTLHTWGGPVGGLIVLGLGYAIVGRHRRLHLDEILAGVALVIWIIVDRISDGMFGTDDALKIWGVRGALVVLMVIAYAICRNVWHIEEQEA